MKWTHLFCPPVFLACTEINLFCLSSVHPIPQCTGSQYSHSSKHTRHSAPAAENRRGLFHSLKSCQREDSQLSWIMSSHRNELNRGTANGTAIKNNDCWNWRQMVGGLQLGHAFLRSGLHSFGNLQCCLPSFPTSASIAGSSL